MESLEKNTHSVTVGYIVWFFGFTGAHRFYYGKPVTGAIWFSTFGLFGIGWIIDFFLIPAMDREAELKYVDGPINYNITWLLCTYLGFLGAHRFYMRKWVTGIIWALTGGLLTVGWLYDFCTLNRKISDQNLYLK